jgi:hypothetical protein
VDLVYDTIQKISQAEDETLGEKFAVISKRIIAHQKYFKTNN